MQIPVNKNLDEYKDDFYKGLTLKQTVLSVLTVIIGTGIFLLLYLICGIGQTIALYLAVLAALPVAASGFLKIHGLSLPEYFHKKKEVNRQTVFFFQPVFLKSAFLQEEEQKKPEKRKVRRREKNLILETKEEKTARMRRYEKTNAGL